MSLSDIWAKITNKDDQELIHGITELFDTVQKDYARSMQEQVWYRNCIAEGTIIPLLNGEKVPIESLVGRSEWLFGFDMNTLKIVPSKMEKCWSNGTKDCVEIKLDNGHSFICTKDHRILTWFGYSEAKDLQIGTPLVPFRHKYFKTGGKGATGSYGQVFQPYDAEWQQTHRMVADYINPNYDKKYIIHHINEIKHDNSPDNLQIMSRADHSTLTLEKHKDKIMIGLKKYCSTAESSIKKSISAKRQWVEKRDEMMESLKRRDANGYKEKRKAGIVAFWNNPEKVAHRQEMMRQRWEEKRSAINCRVVSITEVGQKEVFDMSVPATENFALYSGVFVHNCLYYMGEQYLEYVKSVRTFRRRSLPDYIPTPVSNEIKEYVRSCKSLYLGQKYSCTVAPNTNEKEDIKSAELAATLLDNLNAANDGEYHDEVDKLTTAIPIFGTSFLRSFPKMDNDVWLFDKSGNLIPVGDISTEHIIPFQTYCDTLGDTLTKKRWWGIQSLRSKEWVEDTFKVKITASDKNATDYLKRLMKMVSNVSPWKGANVDTSSFDQEDDSLVLFRELEMKPSIKYPNGRYILSCGDKIVKKYDRMPIPVKDGKWYYSLTDFHMDYIPGSFWSEAGVNGIISPQDTINQIDQALAINRKGVARPTMFTPSDIGMKKIDSMGGLGAGMLVLGYDPLLSGGQKPHIEQGVPLPQQILEERAIQRTGIQDISGDPKNILRGQSPGAKASGIMVDTLRETAERGKAPDLDRFRRSLTKEAKKRLVIAQEVIQEDRLLKICGKGNKWKISRFVGADLRNNTDVRMELDSGLASTNAGKMSIIMDLAEKGFFGDISQNQELRDEVLRRVGMSGFTTQESVDTKKAETENAKMSIGDFQGVMLVEQDQQKGGITENSTVLSNDPLFRFDDHRIHLENHRKFILSDEFSEIPPEIQTQAIAHVALHQNMIEEEEKNARPEPKDPREFVQMDKLFQDLTAKEQISYLPTIGIAPDTQERMSGVVGVLNRKDVFAAETDAKLKQMDGSNKVNQEVVKNVMQPKEKEVNEART